MTEREVIKHLIKNEGSCVMLAQLDCAVCPLSRTKFCASKEDSITLIGAEKWLEENPESKYTYLDIDLPEWWDGRPIYGEAWDCRGEDKEKVYCCGIIQHSKEIYTYECLTDKTNVITESFRHFKPLLKQQTSAKVVITKDGKVNEVELTADQIERLGLK